MYLIRYGEQTSRWSCIMDVRGAGYSVRHDCCASFLPKHLLSTLSHVHCTVCAASKFPTSYLLSLGIVLRLLASLDPLDLGLRFQAPSVPHLAHL